MATTNPYHREQIEAHAIASEHLSRIGAGGRDALLRSCGEYLDFRRRTAEFLAEHFGAICALRCYQSRLSACCSREGIVVFFADVVVNALVSEPGAVADLIALLDAENRGLKCVYLGPQGCRWRLKPIVCQMFLCDEAKRRGFAENPRAAAAWAALETERRGFTWPDRPVLFDALEACFIEAGYRSALMYLHESPGMRAVKRAAARRSTGG